MNPQLHLHKEKLLPISIGSVGNLHANNISKNGYSPDGKSAGVAKARSQVASHPFVSWSLNCLVSWRLNFFASRVSHVL